MRLVLIPEGTKGTSSGASSPKKERQKGSDRPAYPSSVHTEMWPLHTLEDFECMRVNLPAKNLAIPDLGRVNPEEERREGMDGGRFLLPWRQRYLMFEAAPGGGGQAAYIMIFGWIILVV